MTVWPMLGWVIVAFASLSGCNQRVAATTPQAEKSRTSAATAKSDTAPAPEKAATRSTTQPARIEPYERTPLFAKIDGYVLKTRKVKRDDGQPIDKPIADIGERVNEGDVLAEIWVPEMDEELKQKQALHAQAKAELDQAGQAIVVAQKGVESAQARISEAEAGMERADGEYERWKSEHARIQQLAANGSVTQKLADETLNQFRAADAARREVTAIVTSTKAVLGEAEANVAKAKADAAAATARLQVAQANIDHMQALLGYAKIRAPFAGVVTQRNIDTGHFVRPPQSDARPLYVVERIDLLRVVVDIPELQAPLVKIGSPASLRLQSLGPDEIEAKVTRTAWSLDPTARTLRVEIDLPNTDNRLRPGMYATARILLNEDQPPTPRRGESK